MTETEENNLRALASELAAAEQSARQPRSIARAFATPRAGAPVFTMQTWIDLDAARSPLLTGELPETDEMHAAVNAFRCGPVELSAKQAVGLGLMMRDVIGDAFAMIMPMTPPDFAGGSNLSDGFGAWLPILAALVAQIGMSRADALATPVGEAFALLAADKRNNGWTPAGVTYAQRDVIQPPKQKEESNG